MNGISRWTMALGSLLVSTAIPTQPVQAQTFTTLYSFCTQNNCADGDVPNAGLIQATDGNFYGTTEGGGTKGDGTVFKITPRGTLTTLRSLGLAAGENPDAGLIQATNGEFYGTTLLGGANGEGTVFKITPSGKLTTLHSFCSLEYCADGRASESGLIQATDGDFYGTTGGGGTDGGSGTIFKITASGILTTLFSFDDEDGWIPTSLIQATNGDFYGTTFEGSRAGTVFKITASGTLTTVYSFCSLGHCVDGAYPRAGLTQGSDGDFYGTTSEGGANQEGTVFKMTPSGKRTRLYSFCSQTACTDGEEPAGPLIQATDGNFYGTTPNGGANGTGTIFKITPSGTLTTLYSFCSKTDCTDGDGPTVGLMQATDGNFYGTTPGGGAFGNGVVFSLSVGLGPFVKTQPTSGKVGAAIKILGTALTGATRVTFNDTAAVFTVVSASEITATVPTGAATGYVKVETPGGTLNSNTDFRVTP